MKINRKEFLQKLTLVKPGLAKKDYIEQTDRFILLEDSIKSFNDEIFIHVQFNTGINGSLPDKELYNILDKFPDEEIEIKQEKEKIIIQGGKNRQLSLSYQELNKALLDGLPEKKEIKNWNQLPEDFSDGLKFCLFSTSSDMTKFILCCLHIEKDKITASDNYRITQRKMKSSIKFPLLIPAESVKQLIKYNLTEYIIEKSWIHFKNKSELTFSCRNVDEKFPDVEKFFNISGKTIQFPDRLQQIIERTGIIIQNEIDYEKTISLTLSKNELHCKGIGSNGEYWERCRINYSGPEINLKINPDFLLQALPLLKKVTIGKNNIFLKGDNFSHIICLQ